MTLFNNVIRKVEIIKRVTFMYFLSDFYKFNTLFLTNAFFLSPFILHSTMFSSPNIGYVLKITKFNPQRIYMFLK